MAASTLSLQLVYIMEAVMVNWIHYGQLNIVTLITCHFTHFHFTEILGYRYITSKRIQQYTEFYYSEYRSSI